MTDGFLSLLDQVQQSYQGQQTHLTGIIETSETELTQIASTLRKLEEKRIDENRRIYQAKEALQGLRYEQQEEILHLIFQEFNAFQRFMAAYLEKNLGVREEIQHQLNNLLAQDPALEQDLAEYHEFMAKAESVLKTIPTFYRNSFEQAMQEQALHLRSCLELEEKLNDIPDRSDAIVPIVLTIDIEHFQMFWALPAAIRTDSQDGNFSQRMDGLENAFIQFLSMLSKDPDWTLLEIERGEWASFRSLTTLIEYSGNPPIRDAIQEYLEQWLSESWPFRNLTPIPEIAELDWDTWLIGKNLPGAELDLKAVVPVDETIGFTEPVTTASKSGFQLFSEKDIVSWGRPLRVSENSAWTISARRLRTLVMRFASQGRIGKDGISTDQIISGLPQEHAIQLEKLVPALVESGIFHQETFNGYIAYTLNPEHLVDIQDLINRDVTQFWKPLI